MPFTLVLAALSFIQSIVQTVVPAVQSYYDAKSRELPTTTRSPFCQLPACLNSKRCPDEDLDPKCFDSRVATRSSADDRFASFTTSLTMTTTTITTAANGVSSSDAMIALFLIIIILAVVAFFCFRKNCQTKRNSVAERQSDSVAV